MEFPGDGHVHSEWSWDANLGAMDATCARAVGLGLPSIAFTEHVDFTPFRAGFLVEQFGHLVTDGTLVAPELDAARYLESVDRCRSKYPELRILTGMEIGQPHLHGPEARQSACQGQLPAADRLVALSARRHRVRRTVGAVPASPGRRDLARVSRGDPEDGGRFGALRGVRPHRLPDPVLARRGQAVRADRLRGRIPASAQSVGRWRSCARDQHQIAVASDDPWLVARGRRPAGHLRQRRPSPRGVGHWTLRRSRVGSRSRLPPPTASPETPGGSRLARRRLRWAPRWPIVRARGRFGPGSRGLSRTRQCRTPPRSAARARSGAGSHQRRPGVRGRYR